MYSPILPVCTTLKFMYMNVNKQIATHDIRSIYIKLLLYYYRSPSYGTTVTLDQVTTVPSDAATVVTLDPATMVTSDPVKSDSQESRYVFLIKASFDYNLNFNYINKQISNQDVKSMYVKLLLYVFQVI